MNRMDHRLTSLSNRLFGEPSEISVREAEALLGLSDMNAEVLLARLARRLSTRAEAYQKLGEPVPNLLAKALDEMGRLAELPRKRRELIREARLAVKRALERAKSLSVLLEGESAPAFSMAYRNRKELSEHDREVLDAVTEEQRKRILKRMGTK